MWDKERERVYASVPRILLTSLLEAEVDEELTAGPVTGRSGTLTKVEIGLNGGLSLSTICVPCFPFGVCVPSPPSHFLRPLVVSPSVLISRSVLVTCLPETETFHSIEVREGRVVRGLKVGVSQGFP